MKKRLAARQQTLQVWDTVAEPNRLRQILDNLVGTLNKKLLEQ